MSISINRVVLVGNLCRDPESKTTAGGAAVCRLRLAVNERLKDAVTGEWRDRANYFDVTAFGALAELCAKHLAKGRQVAVDGRLHWREWQAKDGQRREAVGVVTDSVLFIAAREGAGVGLASAKTSSESHADPDDDIPF